MMEVCGELVKCSRIDSQGDYIPRTALEDAVSRANLNIADIPVTLGWESPAGRVVALAMDGNRAVVMAELDDDTAQAVVSGDMEFGVYMRTEHNLVATSVGGRVLENLTIEKIGVIPQEEKVR